MTRDEICQALAAKWTDDYRDRCNKSPDGEDFAFIAATNMVDTSQLWSDVCAGHEMNIRSLDDETLAKSLELEGMIDMAEIIQKVQYTSEWSDVGTSEWSDVGEPELTEEEYRRHEDETLDYLKRDEKD